LQEFAPTTNAVAGVCSYNQSPLQEFAPTTNAVAGVCSCNQSPLQEFAHTTNAIKGVYSYNQCRCRSLLLQPMPLQEFAPATMWISI